MLVCFSADHKSFSDCGMCERSADAAIPDETAPSQRGCMRRCLPVLVSAERLQPSCSGLS